MEGRTNPSYSPNASSSAPSPVTRARRREPRSWEAPDAGEGIFYHSSWVGMDEYAVEARAGHVFWRVLRVVLLVSILVWWVAMLIACIVMLAQGDSVHGVRCPGEREVRWYDTAVGYQIYPASFQDSDGDGFGDIKGIISRLDYLDYLGVDAIWLGPVFESPRQDFWMDVTDLTAVDGVFGTMQDFEELVAAVHGKNMKLILEFIPNYTSDQHPWFLESRQSSDNDYSDYYIWADGTNGGPPTPSDTMSGADASSSWEYDATRRQWYLYSFIKEEPDLNYRNRKVVQDMQAALRFWLDKGVDGFYIRHTDRIFGSSVQMFSSSNGAVDVTVSSEDSSLEAYNNILDVIAGWRKLLDEYEVVNEAQDNSKLLVVDTGSDLTLAALAYSNKSLDVKRADFPFNFVFLSMAAPLNGHRVRAVVESWLEAGPADGPRLWAVGTADVDRIASRYGERLSRVLLFLMLLLPGSPVIYYGDEIGMTDGMKTNTSSSMSSDPATELMRSDTELTRSPMQWSPDVHAGFTDASSEPWIPVGINASNVNVELQRQNNKSHLAFIRQIIRFHRNNSDLFAVDDPGLFRLQTTYNEIFAFTREMPGSRATTAVFAATNVADYGVTENFESRKERIPSTGVVVVASNQSRLGESVNFSNLLLRSGEALLVQYTPLAKPDGFSEPYEE